MKPDLSHLNLNPYVHNIVPGFNTAGEQYDLEVLDTYNFLNAWDALMEDNGVDPMSDEGTTLFKTMCNQHNVFYYGRPREDFNAYEARDLAANACARYVLMEDMS